MVQTVTILFFIFLSPILLDSSSRIEWKSMEEAIQEAKQTNKMILLNVVSNYCPHCKRMDKNNYSKAEIAKKINRYFIPAKLDINSTRELLFEGNKIKELELARRFKVTGTPTTVFLNEDIEMIAWQPGYIEPEVFSVLVDFIGTGSYAMMSFEEFEASLEGKNR